MQGQGFEFTMGAGRNLGQVKPHVITDAITKGLNDTFAQVIGSLDTLAPQVQKAIVDPLNHAALVITQTLEGRQFKGSGDKLQKQIDKLVQEELPELVENTFGRLVKAAQKIDPLVRQFNDFIVSTQQVIEKLQQQHAQYTQSIDAQINAIMESTMTPAQIYMRRRDELAALQAQFAAASPAGKLALVSQIQQLVGELLQLGQHEDVLGQDPQLVKALQSELIDILTSTKGGTDTVFMDLESALQEQIALAHSQIDILTGALWNLDSIDSATQSAAQALQAMQQAVGILQDPTMTQAQFSAATLMQVDLLANIAGINLAQLAELRRIAGGGSASGNSDTGDSFQAGTPYVPRNMWAFLHQGERVVPAHANTGASNAVHIEAPITINVPVGQDDPQAIAYAVRSVIQDLAQESRLEHAPFVLRRPRSQQLSVRRG